MLYIYIHIYTYIYIYIHIYFKYICIYKHLKRQITGNVPPPRYCQSDIAIGLMVTHALGNT